MGAAAAGPCSSGSSTASRGRGHASSCNRAFTLNNGNFIMCPNWSAVHSIKFVCGASSGIYTRGGGAGLGAGGGGAGEPVPPAALTADYHPNSPHPGTPPSMTPRHPCHHLHSPPYNNSCPHPDASPLTPPLTSFAQSC